MKLNTNFKFLAITLVSFLICLNQAVSLSLRKSGAGDKAELAAERGHKRLHLTPDARAKLKLMPKQPYGAEHNKSDHSHSKSLFHDLNQTYVVQNQHTFKVNNRKWTDNKLLDKQIDEIYRDLVYKENQDITPPGTRASIQIFANEFEKCDMDKDNVLNLKEFKSCFEKDDYLKQIKPPSPIFAAYQNYTYTNSTGFYPILYYLMDSYHLNFTNFHDYMHLRLMIFSWKKCSQMSPFIDEVNFECAIEVAAGWKTMSRTTARRLYQMALELGNSQNIRNIDFITYFIIATSVRTYGKINGKEDSDATKSEFNLALDSNTLPARFNQEIVDALFDLIEEHDRPNQGIDVLSFTFYDFVLRLFDKQTPTRRWFLDRSEFTNTFNHHLFPAETLQSLELVQQNKLTNSSYQMFTYLNISQYHSEADHFMHFVQTDDKIKGQLGNPKKGGHGLTFNLIKTASQIFDILDYDEDGFISFHDWANFVQIAYLFRKFDKYNKGRVVAGDLYEQFSNYADFPMVSYHLRERAHRFNLFSQDLYLDLLRTVSALRVDDMAAVYSRKLDPTTLYEVELKHVFQKMNLAGVPDAYLNKCLRGVDDKQIPKYDWECSFVQGLTTTLHYLESSKSYLTAKHSNLTLANTVFFNVDPQIK